MDFESTTTLVEAPVESEAARPAKSEEPEIELSLAELDEILEIDVVDTIITNPND